MKSGHALIVVKFCVSKLSLRVIDREHLRKEHIEEEVVWKDTVPGRPYNGISFQVYNNGKPLGRTVL